ncbi:MAG: 30S ribosomal protein THX [Rudaea sp.]|uniref:30S ribosomal protein THX n=1 Tax=Rudaea sp. TaxID=2136325 RepID=UPI0039E27106
MGRGDRKTKKGKIAIRSYGNVRPHAPKAAAGGAAKAAKPAAKKAAPAKKAAAAKKPAA